MTSSSVFVNTVAVAEGLVMGAKAGLDIDRLFQMSQVSSGDSYALRLRGGRMVSRDFTPGGTMDISYKDQVLGGPDDLRLLGGSFQPTLLLTAVPATRPAWRDSAMALQRFEP